MEIVQLIQDLGVQVATLVAMMWYIVQKDKAEREDRAKKDEQIQAMVSAHADEVKEFTEALNQNTIAMTKVQTTLDVIIGKENQE